MSAGQLEFDCRESLQDLRGALINLYASLALDPSQSQQVSRRLGINKNLTWKIAKVITEEGPLAAIQHIPGPAGIEILLTSFAAAGGSDEAIEQIRSALRSFDEMVVRHAGARADLDLILDSMGLNGDSGLEASRELAYRGNSGIWGVQARTRTSTGFVTPSRGAPDSVDVTLVGGFVGFRLLRPTVNWRLFRFQSYSGDGSASLTSKPEPLDESTPVGDFSLLKKFCSPNMPVFTPIVSKSFREYYLSQGAVGNTGAFDCFFGEVVRGMPRYASEEDAHGEFASTISLPVETLVFDVMIHRDIRVSAPPSVYVFGRPDGGPDIVSARKREALLPISDRCLELAGRPPAVPIASVPRYGELIHWTCSRLGFAPTDFRGYRLVVNHPPMNSSVVLRWDLEQRPT